LGINAGTGYQWGFKNGFTMSLGGTFGKVWDIGDKNNTGEYNDSTQRIFDFNFNFKLGYSF